MQKTSPFGSDVRQSDEDSDEKENRHNRHVTNASSPRVSDNELRNAVKCVVNCEDTKKSSENTNILNTNYEKKSLNNDLNNDTNCLHMTNKTTKNQSNGKEVPFRFSSLFDYLRSELRRNYVLENDEQRYTERREKFYIFLKIPLQLEKFLCYGFFQCVDAFLVTKQ
ncbi:unnamed protein product [Medioppia subpectinata]|uniref:Uncharacterized protein n=1 Tax=Medioppia subpectinata TaxID=1979941 RepID=A0A7R9KK12_9ACAR|nr:unnamed protein product [Medioppia subpectinata]CAG2105125.1 unnamed protein product [Medioppia subpectinata]